MEGTNNMLTRVHFLSTMVLFNEHGWFLLLGYFQGLILWPLVSRRSPVPVAASEFSGKVKFPCLVCGRNTSPPLLNFRATFMHTDQATLLLEVAAWSWIPRNNIKRAMTTSQLAWVSFCAAQCLFWGGQLKGNRRPFGLEALGYFGKGKGRANRPTSNSPLNILLERPECPSAIARFLELAVFFVDCVEGNPGGQGEAFGGSVSHLRQAQFIDQWGNQGALLFTVFVVFVLSCCLKWFRPGLDIQLFKSGQVPKI